MKMSIQESGMKSPYLSTQSSAPIGLHAPIGLKGPDAPLTMQDRVMGILSLVAECRTRIANVSEKLIGPCPQAEPEVKMDPSLNTSLIIAGGQLENLLADISRIENLL